jgi:hypothetical protein
MSERFRTTTPHLTRLVALTITLGALFAGMLVLALLKGPNIVTASSLPSDRGGGRVSVGRRLGERFDGPLPGGSRAGSDRGSTGGRGMRGICGPPAAVGGVSGIRRQAHIRG